MSSTGEHVATPQGPAEASLSLLQRAIAVFARPAHAWSGLQQRSQWWFPLVVTLLVMGAGAAVLHERALIPMLTATWEEQAANGQLPAERLEQMEAFFDSPAGMAVMVGQQVVVLTILNFVMALIIWFGVGFVLGTSFKYRHGLEVASWSGLVTIPAYLLTAVLAWIKQSFRGVHIGFGIVLPDPDPPTKLLTALGVFLDSIGPFSIWHLVVGVLGAAAISGAARKSVAWVLAGLYLAVSVFMAALAGLFVPGS